MRPGSFRTALIDHGPAWLLGAAPFVFLRTGGEFENQPKMLFLQWGVAALALLRLSWPTVHRRGRRGPAALDVAVVLFYLCCAGSLVWATSPARAAVVLMHLGAAVVFYFLFAHSPHPSVTLRSLCVAAAASSGIVSLIGLLQYGFDLRWIPQAQPPASTFSNRNLAAHFVVICLPLAAAALVEARRTPSRLAAVAAVLSSIAYLYVTRTRAAWLALIAVVALGSALLAIRVAGNRPGVSRRLVSVALLAALMVGVAVAGTYAKNLLVLDDPFRADSASVIKLGTGTARLRLVYWKNTLAMIGDRFPLGVGLAHFGVAYPLYHRAAEEDWTFSEEHQLERAHNDHLQVLAELGPAGFAAYVAMLLLFFDAWRRVLVRASPGLALQSCFPGLAVLALIVVATFSFPLERAMPPVYLFACMGAMASLVPAAETGSAAPSRRRWAWARVAAALGLVGFMAASGYLMRRAILSDARQARALEALARGSEDEAASHLAVARELSLGDPAVPLLIARGHAAAGRYERAADELRYALRLHPNKINTILNLGYVQLQLGRYDEAERQLRRALEIFPASLTAYSNLGLIHYRRQEYEEAIPYYRKVLELAPGRQHYSDAGRTEEQLLVAHLQLGGAYAALGDRGAAVEQYERALELKPDLDQVRAALSGLRE